MPIAASELILNPDGSIYHLGLKPEDVAPVVITVGDPDRAVAVAQRFDRVLREVQRREFRSIIGQLDVANGTAVRALPIMVISTGIGTDNVDIVLNELDALVNIDFETRQIRQDLRQLRFLRLGTSGTFQPGIPVDSLLASLSAIGLDGLGSSYAFKDSSALTDFTATFGRFAANAYTAFGDQALYAAFHHRGIQAGHTLTCAGFYGPQRRRLRLSFAGPSLEELARWRPARQPDYSLTNFEMETAGIYGLAHLLGHQALSISAILANRATGAFSTTPQETVSRLIDMAIDVLRVHADVWWTSSETA